MLDSLVADANAFVEMLAADSTTAAFTERPLLAAAWSFGDDSKRFSRFPEVLQMDVTCKTNALDKPFLNFAAVDGNGSSFTPMQALLQNETFPSLRWALASAAPWCLQPSALATTSLLITDEDAEERNAFQAAKASGVFGQHARHRICAWHALHQAVAMPANFGRNAGEENEFTRVCNVGFFYGALSSFPWPLPLLKI